MSEKENTKQPLSVNDLAMKAVNLFKDGLDCETAVITVFDQLWGTDIQDGLEPKIRRIGLGFQVPCGAVLGAKRVMAKALENEGDLAQPALDLERFFINKHRASTCQYLTAHIKWGEHHNFCGKYVYTAVEGLCSVLEERLGQKLYEVLKILDTPATKH